MRRVRQNGVCHRAWQFDRSQALGTPITEIVNNNRDDCRARWWLRWEKRGRALCVRTEHDTRRAQQQRDKYYRGSINRLIHVK